MNIYDKWHGLRARFKNSMSIAEHLFTFALVILGAVEFPLKVNDITLSISGYLITIPTWGVRLILMLVLFVVLLGLVYLLIGMMYKSAVSLNIRGIKVNIVEGDLFNQQGWKIIPFNEHYDTCVDEKVIISGTLHGTLINKQNADDVKKLKKTIASNAKEHEITKNSEGKFCFELGHLIDFKDYLLLAFSKFNEQNRAHISMQEYEQCMFHMWSEIRRLYQNKPVALPLIGSGITSFDGIPEKSTANLLRCILCTLHASGEHINQPVTIVLRKEALEGLDLYELKWKLKI